MTTRRVLAAKAVAAAACGWPLLVLALYLLRGGRPSAEAVITLTLCGAGLTWYLTWRMPRLWDVLRMPLRGRNG